MQGVRNPEKAPLKSGIFERRACTVVAMTCPVESAAPSREAKIQQGEDERNPATGGTDVGFPTASWLGAECGVVKM
jgi:hypothetical protein